MNQSGPCALTDPLNFLGMTQMTKYLIFKNDTVGALQNESGSREELACEISIAIDMDRIPVSSYVAYVSESPQALLSILKGLPVSSLVLTDENVEIWEKEGEAIRDAICSYQDALDQAYSTIHDTSEELKDLCSESEHFSEFSPEACIESAFEHLQMVEESDFCEKLAEIFEYESLNS